MSKNSVNIFKHLIYLHPLVKQLSSNPQRKSAQGEKVRILKWIGYILGGIVVIIVIALAVFYFMSSQKLGHSFKITPDTVAIPTDEASIERGHHIVEAISDCQGCHTPNLGGDMFLDDPSFAQIAAPNLTSGQGGVGSHYTDEDWVRAIRHGVAADGRQLIIMPSDKFNYMSDEDLGALIAYLKTVPPVDQSWPARSVAFIPTRILITLGAFKFAPELIANNGPRTAPEPAVTTEYGEYLSHLAACRDCHGANLAGGIDEGAPKGPNLTPGGEVGSFREEDFISTIRTGVTPGGRTLSDEMPWKAYGKMTDDELKALYMYLHGLEALPANTGS
jgi:mono/diheme cytochrome c family protein